MIYRYLGPANKKSYNKKQLDAIKLRVCVVLSYWVRHHMLDLDSILIRRLQRFIAETVASDGSEMKEMANRLLRDLHSSKCTKKEERKVNRRSISSLSVDVGNNMITSSPSKEV